MFLYMHEILFRIYLGVFLSQCGVSLQFCRVPFGPPPRLSTLVERGFGIPELIIFFFGCADFVAEKSCGANLDSDCRRSRTCRVGQLRDFINDMWKEQWRSLTVVATKWYGNPEWNKTGCTDRKGLSNKGHHPPVNNGDSYPRIPLTGIRKKENQTLQFEVPFHVQETITLRVDCLVSII